jgi:hypothetical protein
MRKLLARTTSGLAALTAAATAVTLTAAGAYAADATFADKTGDIRPGIDMKSVVVHHGSQIVKVTINHKDLKPHPRGGASGTIWIDADRRDRGPEYAFVGGLFEGTDYSMLAVEGWSLREDARRFDCDHSMRLRYLRDQTVVRMAQECFGDAQDLRFEVRTGAQRADGVQVKDWLGPKRHFTKWVPAA